MFHARAFALNHQTHAIAVTRPGPDTKPGFSDLARSTLERYPGVNTAQAPYRRSKRSLDIKCVRFVAVIA